MIKRGGRESVGELGRRGTKKGVLMLRDTFI